MGMRLSTNTLQPRSDAPVGAVEPAGRNWKAIGGGLMAAIAIVCLYVAGTWAVVVLVQAVL